MSDQDIHAAAAGYDNALSLLQSRVWGGIRECAGCRLAIQARVSSDADAEP